MADQESWMQPFDIWQKALSEPFLIYAKSMQVVFVPNTQMQKGIIDTWTNMWSQLPQTNFLCLPKVEGDSAKDFSEMLQTSWPTFGMDPFKLYMEFIQSIIDFWMNYWKKSY